MSERERDLERLLTFIDAAVAIAITLLVLPLADAGDQIDPDTDVVALLREHSNDLLAFLISFAVIAQLWLAQHQIVSTLIRQTGMLTWLLLFWTMTIVFLPFPTSLIAATDEPVARVLYIGTMALSSALLALIAYLIGRDRSLRDTDTGPDARHTAAIVVAFLLALAISLAIPATGYLPLLILLLVDPVMKRVRPRS